MKIGGLQKLSLIDFPDRIAAIVFTQGCNLRCPWCHNAGLIPADVSPVLTWQEVLTFLKDRQCKLDGVVLTGGEPLMQDDLADAIRDVKALDYAIKLDTNGTLPDRLEKLLMKRLPDYVAMDLKASPGSFALLTGRHMDFARIRESIRLIMESGIPYEFRTTLIPGMHSREVFEAMLPLISGAKHHVLQNLSGFPTYDRECERLRPYNKETLLEFQKLAASFVDNCTIRNS